MTGYVWKHLPSAVYLLKSMLDDEISSFIETRKENLRAFIVGHKPEIIDFVKKSQLEITDWKVNPPFGKEHDPLFGTIKSIISVKPIGISDVIGGAPNLWRRNFGESLPCQNIS